jgi:very-short-patch-repair endonuclease
VDDKVPSLIRGQKISRAKFEMSKGLRQQMTPEERILWERLRRNGLNGIHFRRQQVIDGYIVDFYCQSANLIIEVDGEVHEY